MFAAFGIVKRTVHVSRITAGHGTSELGFEITLNEWDDIDIPELKEGDELVVYIRRK